MVCTPARDAGERQTKAVSTWSAHSLQINGLGGKIGWSAGAGQTGGSAPTLWKSGFDCVNCGVFHHNFASC